MKSWQLAVVGSACLMAAGCRADPNIALLERELRLQEDEIYRLRGVVEDYQAALRTCRQEATPSGRSATAAPGANGLPGLPRLEGIPDAAQQTSPPPDTGTFGDPQSEAPPSPYPVPSPSQPDEDSPQDEPLQYPGDLELPIPDPSDDDDQAALGSDQVRLTGAIQPISVGNSQQVARIELNRRLTSGYDSDRRPGDDGVAVAIELRDDRGRWIDAAADLSVVLLDPALDGEAARVARWDFSAAEIATHLQRTSPGRAIRLKMPWPADPPVHSELYLFVRYTTSDGRHLQTEGPIQVTLPGETSQHWVPVEPPEPTPAASRATDHGQPHPAEPGRIRPTPAIRLPDTPSRWPNPEPSGPSHQRPTWSPYRQ